MTERVLRALGGTDEKYILAYAEKMKEKNPKKIVLRRWLSVAAAAIVIIVGIFIISFHKERVFIQKYDSYETMAEKNHFDRLEYGTFLSEITYSNYEKASFSRYFLNENDSVVDLVFSTYVVELEKDKTRSEIIFVSEEAINLPTQFKTKKPYNQTFAINNKTICFEKYHNRIEGEFSDKTGYYKIISYTNDFSEFKALLSDLFN